MPLSAFEPSQPRLVATLRRALASGRMHHAYLLVGSDEARARELALAVTAALVCTAPTDSEPCGTCAPCRKLAGGNHPDVFLLTPPPDKDGISVQQVRDLASRVALRPMDGPRKVVIISPADACNALLQNKLLKTLEEPPGDTTFFLVTTRFRALLPTIRSRCLTLRLAPPDRLRAWRSLEQTGMDAQLSRVLGPLAGEAGERATELADLGAAEILASVDRVLEPSADESLLLATAADLGQKRERADLALSILELRIRDALAHQRGVASEQCYDERAPLHVPPRRLAAAARRLGQLRRLAANNINRTLALEAVLHDLGVGGAR